MIVYLVGVPGAGKTYYAVNEIFEDVKKNKHQFIYTNINQFNFNFSSKIKKFDFDVFQKNILDLYKLYKDKSSTDEDLIKLVKNFNYYKTIFVIDEAHNFFDSLSTVFVWLFSYHRHIFIDFLFITQNLALIETKYKKFAEYFVRAVPTILQFSSKTFKYRMFIDSRMSAKSESGIKKIKKTKEIFDLYHSGDTVKSPNVIKKYLIFFLIGLFIISIMFYFVMKIMKGSSNVSFPSSSLVSKRDYVSSSSSSDSSRFSQSRRLSKKVINDNIKNDYDIKYYYLSCIGSLCKFKNYDFVLTPISLSSVISEFSCVSIFKETTVSKTSYLLKCHNITFLNQFKIINVGAKNDKISSFNSSFFMPNSR